MSVDGSDGQTAIFALGGKYAGSSKVAVPEV